MLSLRVEFPKGTSRRLLQLLDPGRVKWAEAEALNSTAGKVQRLGVQLVSQQMGIPPAKLAKRGRRVFGSSADKYGTVSRGRRANRRRLFVTVHGVGRPFNVVRFKGVPIRQGSRRVVGVQHQAWGRTQVAMGVWQLVNMPGRPFVIRQGRSFRGVFGPGVRHVLEYPHISGALLREAQRQFPRFFANRIEYAFSAASHLR